MLNCEICGKKLKVVNNLHLRIHDLSISEYERMFPEAPTCRGRNNPMYGKSYTRTEEHRKKISKILKDKAHMKGKSFSKDVKEKISRANKKWWKDHPAERKKQGERVKRTLREHGNPVKRKEVREKISKAKRGKTHGPHSLERRRKISESLKKSKNHPMKRPEVRQKIREKLIENMKKGVYDQKPTKPEREFMEIVDKFDLPYKYVGDGQFWIGNPPMNPDFLRTDGEDVVVEILGNYWHTQKEFDERKEMFWEYGFKCIGIWENELKELGVQEVAIKVK